MAVRHPTQRRLALAVRVALAAVAASALVLVAPVRVDGGEVAWGASCAEAATSQATVNIGMVVDFGVLKGAGDPTGQRVTCVPVAPGRSGLELLTDAGHDYRLNGSGLLCAIDGLPAGDECGERTSTGSYRYWAYFHGAGASWRYAGIGPTYHRATTDGVEGWHFVEGAGNPSDPPPRRSPASICPVTPPPTAPPTTPRPVVPTPAPPAPSMPSPAPGGAPVAPGVAPPGDVAAGDSSAVTSSTAPGATSTDGVADPAGDATAAGADPSSADAERGEEAPAGSVPGEVGTATDVTVLAAAQTGSGTSATTGAAPVATVAAVIVVAALGGVAAWRFRSRSDDIG